MSAENDGGPAFPMPAHSSSAGEMPRPVFGMTLRDWFAGQALAGFIACPNVSGSADTFARDAYGIADAMLRAREGGAR